jgi:hypothetical protein
VKVPVDEAPAGSAMDAAVAEVLGWLPYECDAIWYWKDMSDDDFPYYNYVAYSHNVHSYELEDVKVWSPSTDIAAAWELLEGFTAQIATLSGGMWGVILGTHPMEPTRSVKAETAPLAICRAFLRASGVIEIEVDDEFD